MFFIRTLAFVDTLYLCRVNGYHRLGVVAGSVSVVHFLARTPFRCTDVYVADKKISLSLLVGLVGFVAFAYSQLQRWSSRKLGPMP